MLTRRSMLGATLASCAMPASAATQADAIRALYRHAIVINGNLGGGYFEGTRIPPVDAAAFRRSGLTAFKTTLGGDSMDRATTLKQIDALDRAIAVNGDLFVRIRTPTDVVATKRTGRIGIIGSFEGASMLEGRVDAIDAFRARDVLVMGLSYNLQSPFGSGTLVKVPTGLTPLGREAIARMNRLGITLDISHSDEPTSLAAIAASRRPVLITHAGCAAVHPHPRNKSDALIRALAGRGGVIGIYELSFLTDGSHQQSLADYMAHMVHALDVAGEDHVAVGSDADPLRFDTSAANMKDWWKDIERRKRIGVGAPGEGPPPFVTGLNRPDRMEVIAQALAKRGYRSAAIEKVLGANLLRVFSETWTAAA